MPHFHYISDTGRFYVSRHRLFVFNSVGCNMIFNARLRFQTLQVKKVLACVRMSFLRQGDVCTPVKKFQYFGELILDFAGKKNVSDRFCLDILIRVILKD